MFAWFSAMISLGLYSEGQSILAIAGFAILSLLIILRFVLRFLKHRRLFRDGKKVIGKIVRIRAMKYRQMNFSFPFMSMHAWYFCTCRYEYEWKGVIHRSTIHFPADDDNPPQDRLHVMIDVNHPNRSIVTYPFDRIAAMSSFFFGLFHNKSK